MLTQYTEITIYGGWIIVVGTSMHLNKFSSKFSSCPEWFTCGSIAASCVRTACLGSRQTCVLIETFIVVVFFFSVCWVSSSWLAVERFDFAGLLTILCESATFVMMRCWWRFHSCNLCFWVIGPRYGAAGLGLGLGRRVLIIVSELLMSVAWNPIRELRNGERGLIYTSAAIDDRILLLKAIQFSERSGGRLLGWSWQLVRPAVVLWNLRSGASCRTTAIWRSFMPSCRSGSFFRCASSARSGTDWLQIELSLKRASKIPSPNHTSSWQPSAQSSMASWHTKPLHVAGILHDCLLVGVVSSRTQVFCSATPARSSAFTQGVITRCLQLWNWHQIALSWYDCGFICEPPQLPDYS